MALSEIDRLLIKRTQEAMEHFTAEHFHSDAEIANRKAFGRCPAPGCTTRTNGGPCKKHWRMRRKGEMSGMSEGGGKTRR